MSSVPSCPCGGKPALAQMTGFIRIACQSCGRSTDWVTTVYQSDAEAMAEARALWAEGRPMSKETGYEVVAVHEIYMGDPAPEKLAPLTPQEEARLRALLSLPEAEATTVLSRECLRVQVLRLFLTLDAERAWRRTDG